MENEPRYLGDDRVEQVEFRPPHRVQHATVNRSCEAASGSVRVRPTTRSPDRSNAKRSSVSGSSPSTSTWTPTLSDVGSPLEIHQHLPGFRRAVSASVVLMDVRTPACRHGDDAAPGVGRPGGERAHAQRRVRRCAPDRGPVREAMRHQDLRHHYRGIGPGLMLLAPIRRARSAHDHRRAHRRVDLAEVLVRADLVEGLFERCVLAQFTRVVLHRGTRR